ncbi:hypothetical protein LJB76_01390 [Clostridia bacterium OttesenSCG-928-O13]|nr:hypothetical protein [Clostridia bacterium OttesenSCG-928-O13]
MNCPRCGSPNLHPITETESETKGYGAGKGCLGYLVFGPLGLLCGACGMGEGKSRSKSYWVCGQCGNKFRM